MFALVVAALAVYVLITADSALGRILAIFVLLWFLKHVVRGAAREVITEQQARENAAPASSTVEPGGCNCGSPSWDPLDHVPGCPYIEAVHKTRGAFDA